MSLTFTPNDAIQRFTQHHNVDPALLVSGLICALADYQVKGAHAYPDALLGASNVLNEVAAVCLQARDPRDPTENPPKSLLETLAMVLEHHMQANEAKAAELIGEDVDPASITEEQAFDGQVAASLARSQSTLLLIIRDCINQLDRIALELAVRAGEQE